MNKCWDGRTNVNYPEHEIIEDACTRCGYMPDHARQQYAVVDREDLAHSFHVTESAAEKEAARQNKRTRAYPGQQNALSIYTSRLSTREDFG